MRRLTTAEGYAHRLIRLTGRLQQHLKPSTLEYARLFNQNIPKGFDNSHRWRRMEFIDYNYRYGLHNSYAGLYGEIYAEAAFTMDGGDVIQHFSNQEKQVGGVDQTIYINGAKLYNQCKCARVNHSTGKGSTLIAYERFLVDLPTALNQMITIVDVDKRITVAIACKQFVDITAQCNMFGDEIWIPFKMITGCASIHNFQDEL